MVALFLIMIDELGDSPACVVLEFVCIFGHDGMPRSRAETWVQARAAPGPERASPLRRGSPGLGSRSSRDESANKRRNHAGMVPADRRLVKFGARG